MTNSAEGRVLHPKSDWFRSLGFGLFIHWGPYSVLGRGEWAIQDERYPIAEYDEVTRRFTASAFDPEAWVALAKAAGMRYLVLTTCHGDGYCLFNTSTYERNAVAMTPGRDLVAEFVRACRDENMGVGFYYGMSNWYEFYKHFGAYRAESALHTKPETRDKWRELMQMKHDQIRELLTNYGPVDILWLDDTPAIPESYEAEKLYAMVRELQPDCMIGENSRNCGKGDFDVSEERWLDEVTARPWEVCMPLAIRWGYHQGDSDYKSVQTLLRMVRRCVLWGGNFLLNTGPYEDGRMQPEQEAILRELGRWFDTHRHTIWGCRPLPTGHAEWGEATSYDGTHLFIHVDRWMGSHWTYTGLKNKVISAELVGTGQKIAFRQSDPARVTFEDLPGDAPSPHGNVIALKVEGEPDIEPWLRF